MCGFCFVFLFSYRLVIHGCIDRYTPKIIYVTCRNNNRATTVNHIFSNAIQLHVLPSRLMGDQGGKNVGIARFMLSHPLSGLGRRSYITTKSVHNQRNERLWADMYVPGKFDIYFCAFSDFYCQSLISGGTTGS